MHVCCSLVVLILIRQFLYLYQACTFYNFLWQFCDLNPLINFPQRPSFLDIGFELVGVLITHQSLWCSRRCRSVPALFQIETGLHLAQWLPVVTSAVGWQHSRNVSWVYTNWQISRCLELPGFINSLCRVVSRWWRGNVPELCITAVCGCMAPSCRPAVVP